MNQPKVLALCKLPGKSLIYLSFLGLTLGLGGSSSLPAEDVRGWPVDNKQGVAWARIAQVLFQSSTATRSQPYAPNRVHGGIDFGNLGNGVTAVRSPVAGKILKNMSWCGMILVQSGGYNHFFLHMKGRSSVAVGSSIAVGDFLGYASDVDGDEPGANTDTNGDDCIARGAHLHYEIRPADRLVPSDPRHDNTNTTTNPESYSFAWENDSAGPAVLISSPTTGATLARGQQYTLKWAANDPAGVLDASVSLISSSAPSCYGAPSLITIRAGGGYVNSVSWTVPGNLTAGSYSLKIAIRDAAWNWGCVSRKITIR